jgi:hypothetical protein
MLIYCDVSVTASVCTDRQPTSTVTASKLLIIFEWALEVGWDGDVLKTAGNVPSRSFTFTQFLSPCHYLERGGNKVMEENRMKMAVNIL